MIRCCLALLAALLCPSLALAGSYTPPIGNATSSTSGLVPNLGGTSGAAATDGTGKLVTGEIPTSVLTTAIEGTAAGQIAVLGSGGIYPCAVLPLDNSTLTCVSGKAVSNFTGIHTVQTVTSSFTFGAVERVSANTTSAAVAGTLPPCTAALQGKEYDLKKIDSSTNAASITAAGSDLIDGQATISTKVQYAVMSVSCSDTPGRWDVGF